MPEEADKTATATQFEELPDAPPRRRLQLSWSGKLGVCVVIFWAVIVVIGPYISPYHEADILDEALFIVPGSDDLYPATDFQPPSRVAWLGTDYLGRDTLSRTLWGARTTIGISLLSTLLAYLVGVTLGIAAAVGREMARFPAEPRQRRLPLDPEHHARPRHDRGHREHHPHPHHADRSHLRDERVPDRPRSLGLDVMVSDFVEAARVRGEGLWWIITREILPNVAMPMATDFGLRFVYIILFISSLSFLGLGVQPPQSDWGSMVRESLAGLPYGSIAPLVPALAIATLTIAINMIVDDISAHAGGRLAKRMI